MKPTNEPVGRWPVAGKLAFVALLAGIALWLGVALHPLAVDDAFVTYRYAHNLATGNGFVYNTGHPVLSTTAPLYGLILAAGSWLGLELPLFANSLSAAALWVGALLFFVLGQRENTPGVGALAALFYLLSPLLWLSLGLETALFLALALGAILAYRGGRLYGTAFLLALATMTRGDGLILTAVVAADYVLRWATRVRSEPGGEGSGEPGSKRRFATWLGAVGAAGVYVAMLLPFLFWLTWQFGSPLPATLRAKVAQGELGITGFYAYTTYLHGLWILVRARLTQSLLYLLFLPAFLAGLAAMWRKAGWVRLVVAWGAAHLLGYTLLGVTPYYWYYAPLIPALVCASALGIVESARWLGARGRAPWQPVLRWGLAALWVMGLTIALVRSDLATAQSLDGPVPPPENPLSKVLPEAKVGVYEQAGRWLHDYTPVLADVGVTEVGVMGYYAQRPMVDFLGLLEPEVAAALARGDLYWALVRYQPDYLVLTAISPLYAYDLRADPWFQAAYAPVQTFEDPRFWGSPVTIYQRHVPRTGLPEPTVNGLPEGATVINVDFGETRGGQIRLLGADTGDNTVQPGDVLGLTLYWEALGPVEQDYTVFVHLLGQYERVIAQRDAPPGLGARPTSQWTPGQEVIDPYLLALPEAAYAPDQAVWEVGLYDARTGQRLPAAGGTDNVRFGEVLVLPVDGPLHLDFGVAVLGGYTTDRLALSPGESLEVALRWEGAGPADVTVRLLGEQGDVGAQASGDLSREVYSLVPKVDAPPGLYDLEVLVTDPATGQPLPLLGPDGQPKSDHALLTRVRLYP